MRECTSNAVAFFAWVGLASASVAGSVTLHFDLDGDPFAARDVSLSTLDGGVASWTVWASFTGFPPGTYFQGFFGRFTPDAASAGADVGSVANLTNLMGSAGAPPTPNGASVEDVNIFNSALLGTDDISNPIAIFAFELVGARAAGDGSVAYSAEGDAYLPWDPFFDYQHPPSGEFSIISDRLVVPGSGVATALLAGVVWSPRGRRRR